MTEEKITRLDRGREDDERSLREAYRSGLDDAAGGEPVLQAAVTHVLAHGGSMVRAKVCLVSGRIAGLDEEASLDLAVGVEYFHTASLVFDDLPSMDDAEQRRHAPCVHQIYGEGAAVLAALALVNRAYLLIWNAMGDCARDDRKRAANYVDECLGMSGLLGGQSRDIHAGEAVHSEGNVTGVARLKTVPLLRLAVVLPQIITGGNGRLVQSLERFCIFRGLAYQISDDLLDVGATGDSSGKTTERDAIQGRPNMVSLVGVAAAVERMRRLNQLGDTVMESLPGGQAQWGVLDALRRELPSGEEGLDMSVASTAV